MEFFDTHSHYNDEKFNEDREQIIKDTYKSGVTKFVCAGYNIESSKKYMFSFDELSESDEIFFEKYDENINSVDNTIIYNSYQLDSFESTIIL